MYFFRKSNQQFNRSQPVAKRRSANCRRTPLSLEALEARVVLSTVSWINAGGGDWSTAANWSGGVVPNATDDAIINIAVSGPITIDSTSAVHSLLDTTASLDLDGGSLSLAAASSISQNVTISVYSMLASSGNLTVGGALSESGGVLTGSGTVTVDGLLMWTGGTMSGSGTTLAEGSLQLGTAAASDSESLAARTLQNAGSATWASTDTLDQSANSIFQNLANATLTVGSGVKWNAVDEYDSQTGTLDNQDQGTVTVEAGTGTATFNGFFTNEGDLEVSSGTLLLEASGSVAGNFQVDGGAGLQFANTRYVFNSGGSLTGNGEGDDGTVTFGVSSDTIFDVGSGYSIGTTNVESGATVVFDPFTSSTHNLDQSGGNLGGSGLMTVGSGTTTWTGGTMSGSGITQCLGGTLYLGESDGASDSETLAGRMLINDGAGVWYGPDKLTQEENSTFLNYSNATLKIENGGTWGFDEALDTSGTFDNNGTVTVADGSASTVVQPYFLNSGAVEVASGTLQLVGSGACPWSALAVKAGFNVDSGANLVFGGNSSFSPDNYEAYTFVSGAYVSGAGSVTLGSGVSANFATGSTYNPSGETLVETENAAGAGVVFTAGSNVGPLGNVTINSGVVNFSTGSTVTAASLNLPNGSSGTLTGSDAIDVSGLLTWTDGTMSGPGTTMAEGGLDLGLAGGGSHDAVLESRTLINQGVANWVASGQIQLLAGSTFINQLGATFYDQSDGEGLVSDSTGLVDNQGTFVVGVGSTATAAIESDFNNEGQVQFSSGTCELSGDGESTGTFSLAPGAFLELNTKYGISSAQILGETGTNVTPYGGSGTLPTPLGATTLIGAGLYEETGDDALSSLDMTGGLLTVTGTLTVLGPMTWTGGYITGPGTLTVDGGLQLGTGTSAFTEVLAGVTLMNHSTITLTDQDKFAQEDGAAVENELLHNIDIQGDGTWDGDDTVAIDNQGTIEKTAGAGTATVTYGVALVNDGIVTVSSGTLDLEGGGTATGAFAAAAQTTLEFGHSSWAFNSTSNVTGAGTVEFTSAYWPSYFNANSVYNVTGATVVDSGNQVNFLGGDVANLGAVTLEGGRTTLDLSSGSAVSAASLTLSSNAILTGSDQLTVGGQINWTDGTMSGTGTTIADGTLNLGASGDTDDGELLTVRTLDVAGGGTLWPLDTFQQSYGSNFVNTAADTLDLGGGVLWDSVADGTGTIDNQGALIVGVVGETVVTPATIQGDGNFPFLTSPGAIGVYVGGLNLDCDGSATLTLQASFSVLYPCTLRFGGDFTLADGAGIGGAGNVEVPSGGKLWVTLTASYNVIGTTIIDGGTIEFDNSAEAGTLNVSSGDLTGSGTLTVVAGPTVWTGGTMDGVGNTITEGSLQIGLPSATNDQETLDGRTLTNAGTATWSGGGGFSQLHGASFVNQANASLDIDNGLTWSSAGTGTIANAGTIVESASGDTTTLDAALDNTGSVQVQQGTLSLKGGGVGGGSYLVLAGATLTFGNDNLTTTSLALPSDFTAGPLNWAGTLAGSAQDTSGSGLASAGVSLFNGHDYYDGTAFESPTQISNPAALSGNSWTYTILTANFQNDLAYTIESDATANNGGNEPSTITSLLLAPAPIFPTVAMTAPANGTDTNNNQPTLAATASEKTGGSGLATVQFEYSSNGGTTWNNAGAAETSGPFTFTFTTALADGAYLARAIATDNAGNSTNSSAVSFTIDTVAPTVAMTAPASGSYNNNQPTLSATASDNTGGSGLASVQFEYSTNGGTSWANAGAAETSGPFTFTFTTALADGTYLARAIATDDAGNSTNSSAVSFTVDAVPPTSTVAALPATTTKTSFTVSWSGSDPSGPGIASYSVYVSGNGGAYKPFVTATTKTSAVFTGVVGNTYAFYSVATDRLGLAQPTPTSAQATTKVVLPPVVTLKQVRDITNNKHQVTEVLVTFSGPVNSAEADQIGTFHLATPGKGGSYTAKNAGVIKLKSAVYTSGNDTVALTPTKPFALTKPVQLVIYGTAQPPSRTASAI